MYVCVSVSWFHHYRLYKCTEFHTRTPQIDLVAFHASFLNFPFFFFVSLSVVARPCLDTFVSQVISHAIYCTSSICIREWMVCSFFILQLYFVAFRASHCGLPRKTFKHIFVDVLLSGIFTVPNESCPYAEHTLNWDGSHLDLVSERCFADYLVCGSRGNW